MSTKSKIEWTNRTWNPLAGCTRASAGCDNCYAAGMALRLEAMAKKDIAEGKDPGGKRKYVGIATRTASGRAAFNGVINLDYDALNEPLSWRKPQMVFVNSMSDLFHKDVDFKFIDRVFSVMASAGKHTFQVLTKRPDRMAQYINEKWEKIGFRVPENVWLGTSVENQDTADERIPHLLSVPALVRFLSMEPLLGPVDIWNYTVPSFAADDPRHYPKRNGVEWVVVGGESGRNARPMHPDWVRAIRDQCQSAGVPFFFKQWGAYWPSEQGQWLSEAERHVDHDSDNEFHKIGKHAAGRMLDGREWNEMPMGASILGE